MNGFEQHVEMLKRSVPPASLLVYNVREGWEPLCKFLGVPVPDSPFPRQDSYSHIHWKVGPAMFLATVYFFYGIGIVLCVCSLARCCRRWPSKVGKLD